MVELMDSARMPENIVPQDHHPTLSPALSRADVERFSAEETASAHDFFQQVLSNIQTQDFNSFADGAQEKHVRIKDYVVGVVRHLLEVSEAQDHPFCCADGSTYCFNGAFWMQLKDKELGPFLSSVALKSGVPGVDAAHYKFQDELLRQLYCAAPQINFLRPDRVPLVNVKNGTLEASAPRPRLRVPKPADHLLYQLAFPYEPDTAAPQFQAFLDRVLPEESAQAVLAEYIASVFIEPKTLKLEKALLLYGSGANGKSVFFEIIYALLGGAKNVSCYPLSSLTKPDSTSRASLQTKLLNYGTEISGHLEQAIFKQMASREPVEARLLYEQAFIMERYAKLLFNCNELPSSVEMTDAFFRRFLIIPFSVTIPEAEQDKGLANRIIDSELSGVFNWVLAGMYRLLQNQDFTASDLAREQLNEFRLAADSVQSFVAEMEYVPSQTTFVSLGVLYSDYAAFCKACGVHPLGRNEFSTALVRQRFAKERKGAGYFFYLEKAQ